jgi:hypothetical protein
MPIGEFGDKVLTRYKPTHGNNRSNSGYYNTKRIIVFLKQHPLVKTTADITRRVVADFEGTLGDLKESTRIHVLRNFRAVCNLAVGWAALKKNPFDGEQLKRPPSTASKGIKLGQAQFLRILSTADDMAKTWNGLRFRTLVYLQAYTKIHLSECFKITVVDGKIVFPERLGEFRVPPQLAEKLDAWLPVRGRGKQGYRSGRLRFGEKFADDGTTRIHDDDEQAIIAEMVRWEREGLTCKEIAHRLTSKGVPTRLNRKSWDSSYVHVILKRQRRSDPCTVAPAAEHQETESGPQLLFPSQSGKRQWGERSASAMLRRTGEKIGIEGLTFVSLQRFYQENKTETPWWDRQESLSDRPASTPIPAGPISAPRDSATIEDKSIDRGASISPASPPTIPKPRPTWPDGRCPVAFGADGSPIAGQPKKVTRPQGNVIRALVDAGPDGLTGDELGSRTGCPGYRTILNTLAKDPDWRSRIRMAGGPGGHYRLAMPGDD